MHMKLVLRAVVVALVLLLAPRAWADPTKEECVNANSAAQDQKEHGQLLAARESLVFCASDGCAKYAKGDLARDCAHLLQEVNKSIPTVVFVAKDSNDNDLPKTRVTERGRTIVNRLDGRSVELDPGEHRFRFETDGFDPVEKIAIVAAGKKDLEVKVVYRKNVPPPPVAPPPPTVAADSDGDGVPDERDRCPNVSGSENGCPPAADSDGDGIPDERDRCPNVSGSSSNDGCPDAPPPPPPPPPPPYDPPSSGGSWPYGHSAFMLGFYFSPELSIGNGSFGDFQEARSPDAEGTSKFGGNIGADLTIRLYHHLQFGGFGQAAFKPKFHGATLGPVVRAGGFLRYDIVADNCKGGHDSDSGRKDHAMFYIKALGGVALFNTKINPDENGNIVPSRIETGGCTGSDCPTLSSVAPLFGAELGLDALFGNVLGIGLYSRFWYSSGKLSFQPNKASAKDYLIGPDGEPLTVQMGGWEIIGLKLITGF
jgi:hypothetical protein